MASFFEVTLDTTAPSLTIEVLQGNEPGLLRVLLSTDAEAAEVRLWGSIDPTDPVTNAGYGEDEAGAQWLAREGAEELLVRVLPGETDLHVQVRDEVWNQSEVADFGAAPPEAPPTPGPSQRPRPASGVPEKPTPVTRSIRIRESKFGIRSSSAVIRTTEIVEVETSSRIGLASTGSRTGSRTLTGSSSFRVVSGSARLGRAQTSTRVPISSEYLIIRRGDSDEDAAVLALLV